MAEIKCVKKDWGNRTGKSDIKFKSITKLKIAGFYWDCNQTMRNDGSDLKMQTLKLEIIDTRRCFLTADSFQNVIKFY